MVSVTSVMDQYARDFIPQAFTPVLDEALKATGQKEVFDNATSANEVARVLAVLKRQGHENVAYWLDCHMPNRFCL